MINKYSMGYTKVAIKGVSWIGALRVSTRVLAILRTAILARLLSPLEFGLFGIITLVLAFLEVMTETGVNVVLVQEKEEIKKYIDSAWVVSIVRGILISALILLSAPFISNFFHAEDSLRLILLTSTVPLFRGFINPAVVRFQKELKFHFEFIYNFLGFFTFSVVSIFFALLTRSAVSLVVGLIASAFLQMVFSYLIIEPRPRFRFKKEYLNKLLNRGKWVTAGGFFTYLFQNGDDAVVGRILGTAPLGIYQVGYKISTLPITEISNVITRVTFPVYTKITDDMIRLKRAFLKTTFFVLVASSVFGSILFTFPEAIVTIILGSSWLEVVPVLRVLALFGIIQAVTSSTFSLFWATQKQEYVTIVSLASIAGLAVSIFPLVFLFGVVGAGLAALIGALIGLPVLGYFLLKIFKNPLL